MKRVDLHLHSHYSDGTWSPSSLVDHAVQCGIELISLTDHDSLSGLDEARSSAQDRIELVDGLELSVRFAGQDLHVLAFFPATIKRTASDALEPLDRVLRHNRAVRVGFAEDLVRKLNQEGLPLSMESIWEKTGPGTVGKSHITKAIVACGIANDITVAYRRFFDSNSDYFQERLWVEAEEAFSALERAGALTVLAHPGYKGEATEILVRSLKDLGLDGIEVFHPYHKQEEKTALALLAAELNMVITGGSDCHGPYEGEEPYMNSQNLASDEVATFLDLII
ncbi:PHP domain-containing protein [bacterium]|nr:PHP domain-containing protein [bacterium]